MASRSIKLDTGKLSTAIAVELRKLFETIKILDVILSPDTDRDGNEILRVDIIFSGALRDSDAKNIAGASRMIMPAIDKLIEDDEMYPLLSFVSKLDYDRRPKSAAY